MACKCKLFDTHEFLANEIGVLFTYAYTYIFDTTKNIAQLACYTYSIADNVLAESGADGIVTVYESNIEQDLNLTRPRTNESESWCQLNKLIHWYLKINLQSTTDDGRDGVLYFKIYIFYFCHVFSCCNMLQSKRCEYGPFHCVMEYIKEWEKKNKEEKIPINSIGNMASANESCNKFAHAQLSIKPSICIIDQVSVADFHIYLRLYYIWLSMSTHRRYVDISKIQLVRLSCDILQFDCKVAVAVIIKKDWKEMIEWIISLYDGMHLENIAIKKALITFVFLSKQFSLIIVCCFYFYNNKSTVGI
ncbi:hypothetical protein RFI_39230 [Reticulomyxa filosa]|uniref:Uncharacterized protein n=1 Tax=Reticulomyxa filosa TaxID=46433 RepID=X6LA93_RETFI|nr:hypothetical protein RFI_39230 [Reticulomyxa filosa]|eukprot:ETN98280.1 hypothetical protein RFI_39230 [Reticulomyxa filosa]